MSQQEALKEYIVSLGFKTDEASLKKFSDGVQTAAKNVMRLVASIEGAALAVGAGVAAFANNLEALYYAAQKTGSSATNIKAFTSAVQNLTGAGDEAMASIQSLAKYMRTVPGSEGFLKTMGVNARDANGQLRDTTDIMVDLGKSFGKMPYYLANNYAGVLGIGEDTLRAMVSGDFAREIERMRQRNKDIGFDKASADAHKFMTDLRDLQTYVEAFGLKVQDALMQKLGLSMEKIATWFKEDGPRMADRVAELLVQLIKLAEMTFPALEWLINKLVELDKDTDGWSTKIIVLTLALQALGALSLVSGIAGLAAAFTGLGTAIGAAAAAWGALWLAKKMGLPDVDVQKGREALARGDYWEASKYLPAGEFVSAITGGMGDYAKLIARGEGDYNSVNRGLLGSYKSGTENLESMTVAEVMAAQKSGKFNAAGRYQVVAGTLSDAVQALGMNGSEKFDRATQDRIFSQYLIGIKRPKIRDYIAGRSDDLWGAVLETAKEWAGVADPRTGKSYYDGVGNNRASIGSDEVARALMNARANSDGLMRGGALGSGTYAGPGMPGGGKGMISISQSTNIHMSGTSDPVAAGRAAAGEQDRVNQNLVRNLNGALD